LLSADENVAAYSSTAANFITGTDGGIQEVFVFDRVSVSAEMTQAAYSS